MLALRIGIILILLLVFVQDLCSRSVSWPAFPALALCGLASQLLLSYPLTEVLRFTFFNLIFLGLQFLCIRLYFLITRGRKTTVVDHMIGWGDLLFLISAAFFLPVSTFIAFYVLSLLLVLIAWLLYMQLRHPKHRQIPLAGLQAFILALFLAGGWLSGRYDLYDDQLFTFLIR